MLTLPRGLAAACVLAGCSQAFTGGDDDLSSSGPSASDSAVQLDSGSTDVVVAGVVTGADTLPMAGVLVTGPSGAATTGVAGDFRFTLAPMGGTVRFTRGGYHDVLRTFRASNLEHIRVAMSPAALATPIDAQRGGTVVHTDGSTLVIPAESLGGDGVAAVSFSPIDLDSAGVTGAPNNIGANGELPVVYGAVVVKLEGILGDIQPATPLQARLVVTADTLAGTLPVLRDQGEGWIATGQASITGSGPSYFASFEVLESGTYAVGHLVDGCTTGQLLDGAGAPVRGATVRSYQRPRSGGAAAWIDDSTTAEDGRFTLLAPTLGAFVYAQSTQTDGTVSLAYTAATGSGSLPDPTTCSDLGTLTLSSAGCAIASVYAANASRPPPSPFNWGEGDYAYSDDEGTLTLWTRPGVQHNLVGPGNFAEAFSTSAGTSPAAGDCSRLGNLQFETQCLVVMATDTDGAALQGAVVEGGIVATNTGTDGTACVAAFEGTAPFTATAVRGAQRVSTQVSATVVPSGGTCAAGECTEGPTLTLPAPGCVSGKVFDESGNLAAGTRVMSSTFDAVDSDVDGAYTLSTGGSGTAGIWTEGRDVTWFDEAGAGECTNLDLYSSEGEIPAAIIADAERAYRVERDGAITELFAVSSGWPGNVSTLHAHPPADRLLAVHAGNAPYLSALDGTGFALFETGFWSAGQISPNGLYVALQGSASINPAVSVFNIDGTLARQISTRAGTTSEGLAWSGDGVWIASTRADNAIEVTPSSGARGPTTIANASCTFPVWWDNDTVALSCDGSVKLVEMDASSTLDWLDTPGSDDRVHDTASIRVLYSSGDSLFIASIDRSDSLLLYTGSPGTTYDDVQFDATGAWLLAIVRDPVAGTDVLTVRDQVPYAPQWLTASPAMIEAAAVWAE